MWSGDRAGVERWIPLVGERDAGHTDGCEYGPAAVIQMDVCRLFDRKKCVFNGEKTDLRVAVELAGD